LIKPVFEILKAGFFFNAGKKSERLDNAEQALKDKEKMDSLPPSSKSDVIDSLQDGDF